MKLIIFIVGKTKKELVQELKDMTNDIEQGIERHGCIGSSNESRTGKWDYSFYPRSNEITEHNIKGL